MSIVYFILGCLCITGYFYIIFKKAVVIRNSKYWFFGWFGSLMLLSMSFGLIMKALQIWNMV